MERLLFKKVEIWLVLLILLLGILGTVLFGAIVRNEALGHDRFGRLGDVAYAVASFPAEARAAIDFQDDLWMSVEDNGRFDGRSGWTFSTSPSGRPDGFLLLSRYDGDIARHVVELVDLQTGGVAHRTVIRSDEFLSDWVPRRGNEIASPEVPERFRAIHPFMMPNGDLIVKDHHSPLARLSPCGGLLWLNDEVDFHHSTEMGPDGTIWVPTRFDLEADIAVAEDFQNMGVTQVSPDGVILFQRSMGDLFIERGLEHLVLEVQEYKSNPMHLNDIQPVFEDGPFWRVGDLFLSFRELSAIVLYRPSTDRIVWMKRGPWRAQHDVDIQNDHMISIFNNDVINSSTLPHVREANRVSVFDFEAGQTSGPFDSVLERKAVRASFGGLHEFLPGGFLMIEETPSGRLLIFNGEGEEVAEFVNRSGEGKIFFMGWSRYIDRPFAEKAISDIRGAEC